MSEKKYNNKWLLGVLVVLAAVFFLTDLFRSQSRRAQQLPDQLISLDTAQVNELTITTPQGETIRLERQDAGAWQITGREAPLPAHAATVQRVMADLNNLQPERLISRSPDAWAKFSVNDSLATRVALRTADGTTRTIYIGRFNYQPPPGGMNAMGQNQQISGSTYVRMADEDAVYSTDGFLAMTVPSDLASWRDPTFLRARTSNIREVRFDYPDAAFTLSRQNGSWTIDGQATDSTAVTQYLNRFLNRPNRQFEEAFEPDTPPTHTLTLRGDNMADLVIRAWPAADDGFILHSSLNPDAFFRSPADGVFEQLFVDRSFLTGG